MMVKLKSHSCVGCRCIHLNWLGVKESFLVSYNGTVRVEKSSRINPLRFPVDLSQSDTAELEGLLRDECRI